MSEIGNPQGRFYGWLGGIVDGEGTISIQHYTKPSGSIRLSPFVSITNTNVPLLEECMRIINLLGVVGNKNIRLMWRDKGTNRACYNIRIDGHTAVRSFLERVGPYLFTKTEQSDLVLEFISRRRLAIKPIKGISGCFRQPYGRRDIEIVERIRAIHHRKPSTTLRTAPNVTWGDDKV